MTEQLSFDLPVRRATGRDAFFVSRANAVALAILDNCATWPMSKMILVGAKGSGKSHMAEIWCTDQQAQTLTFDCDLPPDGSYCLVEDITNYATNSLAQDWLFHVHNHLQNTGGVLLMTARLAPLYAGFTLPDLQSRLLATSTAHIESPDDDLLRAVLVKHFSDRQILPAPNVLAYLLTRMGRSFESAAQIADQLDQLALARGKPITRAMAAEIL